MMRKLLIKNKNKGFTLTEILAVLVILGIIIAIAVPSVSKLQDKFKKEYYSKLDDTVLEAGKMYYKDNSNSRPVNILEYTSVDIDRGLIGNKYLESAYEYNTKNNCEGKVVIAKVNDGYLYKTCMECGDNKLYSDPTNANNIDNLCYFDKSDKSEGYDINSDDMYLHVGNYSNEELKNALCIGKTIKRTMKFGEDEIIIYSLPDIYDKTSFCPKNINGIDYKASIQSDKSINVIYDDDNSRSVYLFQHSAPIIKNEINKVVIDNEKHEIKVNGYQNLILYLDDENNKFKNVQKYNSEYVGYQYKINNKWIDVCQDSKNYVCEIDSSNVVLMNDEVVKFRVVGRDLNSGKLQFGNEIEYKIVDIPVQIQLLDCDKAVLSVINAAYGFNLPDGVPIPSKSGYIFEGYKYGSYYYGPTGNAIRDSEGNSICDLKENVTFQTVCSSASTIPTAIVIMTDIDYNEIPNGSNIKNSDTVYFNMLIRNTSRKTSSWSIKYGDGTTATCTADSSSEFFNKYSSYKNNYTRYYCGSHTYAKSGSYSPEMSFKYTIQYNTTTVKKTLSLKVPKISIYYKASNGVINSPSDNGWSWRLDTYGEQSNVIYYSSDGSTYDLFKTDLVYGETISKTGLADYNNSNYINVSKVGYNVPSGAEWKCVSGCSDKNKTFSQASDTNYTSDDFCSGSNGNCSVYLDVNWVPNTYSISYNLNSGTQASSGVPTIYTYGVGATINGKPTRSGYKFNGWSTSSSLSSPSFAKTISNTDTGNKTYYAKWCQNCSSVSNGSCSLNANTAGKCTYTTSCNTGYTLTSGSGTRNPVCTVNKVKVKYYIPENKCTITDGPSDDTWSINSSNYLTKTGTVYETTLKYGQTDGNLINYDYSDNFTVSCSGVSIPSGKEWRNKSDADNDTKVFSQADGVTSANDLCNASNGDCTEVLYLNRILTPSCSISISGTTGNKVGTKQWYKEKNATISLNTKNAENNKTGDTKVTYGLSTESSPSTRYNKTSSLSQGSTQGTTYYGFVRRITNVGTIENTCEKTVYVDVDKPTFDYCSAISKENLEKITGPRADGYVFFKCRYYDSTSYIDKNSGDSNYCYNVSTNKKDAFIKACSSTANESKAVCKNTTSVDASDLLVADSHVKLTETDESAALSWIGVSQYCYKNYALGIGYRFSVCDKAGNCRSSGYQYHEKK
ncbi:MAG: InlB B-repeat-containing protein [bacterium]|nr:InlB B-repeat-containing protein [bacterium]